uniref:Uncharacterized protein n=1 Tax=Leersia perrieri TaxID=77586 RepID=A0A0D9WK15_9ORYZ
MTTLVASAYPHTLSSSHGSLRQLRWLVAHGRRRRCHDVCQGNKQQQSSNNRAAVYGSLPPGMVVPPLVSFTVQIEAVRRWHEIEKAIMRLVNHLVTCTCAIQAGDYIAMAGSLSDAREILTKIPTHIGIGRVLAIFTDALSERLFPMFPNLALPPPLPRTKQRDLFRGFYEVGPYLKFPHFIANRAILKAFESYGIVHVIDFILMDDVQWPPPLAIEDHDELCDVGIPLAEFAWSCNVPFSFRGIARDQIDCLCPWMLHTIPSEAIAINAMIQLHRLLVDQNTTMAVSSSVPIDIVLDLIASLNPKVFTEADHNMLSLLERFNNSLFYYAVMFDSLEAASCHVRGNVPGNPLIEALL